MKLLIAYASTQGQTRKIARHLSDRLVDAGHTIELLPVSDGDTIDLNRFDRIVLAASVHAGHYQKALSAFVARDRAGLEGKPVLFLSVSLAAAGHDADDWRGLDQIIADFSAATGWTPPWVEHVAGAYRPSAYDPFTRFIMRRIIALKDPEADLALDHEYTDWPALDQTVDSWLQDPTP